VFNEQNRIVFFKTIQQSVTTSKEITHVTQMNDQLRSETRFDKRTIEIPVFLLSPGLETIDLIAANNSFSNTIQANTQVDPWCTTGHTHIVPVIQTLARLVSLQMRLHITHQNQPIKSVFLLPALCFLHTPLHIGCIDACAHSDVL
jgi:hypothetical protein